jgi:small conductance mechanosensitive channel
VSWTDYLPTIITLVIALALIVGGYALAELAAGWLRRRGAPASAVRWVRFVTTFVGFLLGGATLFVAFGPLTVAGGLTLSAVVGLAVTLALQTVIGNVFAGLILLRDRVLRLDDRVIILGTSGTVVRLGLVTTWLRLDDGSLASFSNSNILNGPLVNKTAVRRLEGEF